MLVGCAVFVRGGAGWRYYGRGRDDTQVHPRLGAVSPVAQSQGHAGRALAAIEGRDYVRPDDVKRLAHPVLAHRLVLSSQTRLRGRTVDDVLDEILRDVPVPIADRT